MVAFAVNVVEVATPLVLAVSISVAVPFINLPLAPDPGAVKVTEALTGFPWLSVTVATKGAANAVLTVALCGVPLVAATAAAGPALFVRL